MLGMERGTSEKARKFARNFYFPVVCITILLSQKFQQIVICLFSWDLCQFFGLCQKGFLYEVAQKGVSMTWLCFKQTRLRRIKNYYCRLKILNCYIMNFGSRLWSVKTYCFNFSHTIHEIAWTKYSGCKESEFTPGTNQASNKC